MANYRGIVITDGYSGYDPILAGLPIAHAGCNAHARRYFVEPFEIAGDSRAAPAVQFFKAPLQKPSMDFYDQLMRAFTLKKTLFWESLQSLAAAFRQSA